MFLKKLVLTEGTPAESEYQILHIFFIILVFYLEYRGDTSRIPDSTYILYYTSILPEV